MTDTGVASLTAAMDINTTLERLYIFGNRAITDNGLTCLVEVLSRSSRLRELAIPKHVKVDEIRQTINEARERRGLKAMRVIGMYVSIVTTITLLYNTVYTTQMVGCNFILPSLYRSNQHHITSCHDNATTDQSKR